MADCGIIYLFSLYKHPISLPNMEECGVIYALHVGLGMPRKAVDSVFINPITANIWFDHWNFVLHVNTLTYVKAYSFDT